MSDSPTLRGQVNTDRLSTNALVWLFTILLAVPLVIYFEIQKSPFWFAFFLMSSVLFITPTVYGFWPVEYETGSALVWTIVAGVVTGAIYISIHQVLPTVLDLSHVSELSFFVFLITAVIEIGIAIIYQRLHSE